MDAGLVGDDDEINVGKVPAFARRARSDLEIDGIAGGAVDQMVAVGNARLEAGRVARPQHGLAFVLDQRQLAFNEKDELVLVLVPMAQRRESAGREHRQVDAELSQAGSIAETLARTTGDPAQLQSAIRAGVAAVDPDQPISFFATLDTNVANSLGVQRIVASLTSVFAIVALILSAIGLYSVVAYAVSQRRPEIGIRMALGAQRGQVVGMIMRSGLQLVALGLVVGFVAAAGAGRLISSLLYDVKPLDLGIYAGVAVVFTAIAALACLIPSLRAARIDPLLALRAE